MVISLLSRAFQFVPYYFLLGCNFFQTVKKIALGGSEGGNLSLLHALINTTKGAQRSDVCLLIERAHVERAKTRGNSGCSEFVRAQLSLSLFFSL